MNENYKSIGEQLKILSKYKHFGQDIYLYVKTFRSNVNVKMSILSENSRFLLRNPIIIKWSLNSVNPVCINIFTFVNCSMP